MFFAIFSCRRVKCNKIDGYRPKQPAMKTETAMVSRASHEH